MRSIQDYCSRSRKKNKKKFTVQTGATNAALAAVAPVYLTMHKISHSKAVEMPDFTTGICVKSWISKSCRKSNEWLLQSGYYMKLWHSSPMCTHFWYPEDCWLTCHRTKLDCCGSVPVCAEMVQPVPTRAVLHPAKAALCALYVMTIPTHLTYPTFLLAQNLSSKQIMWL